MTGDDLEKLIGGYATGSLTEAEKKALFEAALDDQDLFEQLAREQALKEILDEPGAKQRLIAALSDPKPVWWRRPLVWSLAGAIAVAVVAVTWIVDRRPQPVEIAQVQVRPPVVPPPAATQPPAARPAEERKTEPAKNKVASAAVKDAAPARESDEKRANSEKAGSEKRDALKKTEAAAPRQETTQQAASQSSQDRPQAQPQTQTQAAPFVAGGRQQAAQGFVAPAAPALRAAKAAAPRFSFDYALEDQYVTFKFAAEGYFSMHFSPGNDTIVASHVTAGQTRREYIPNNSTEAAIVFSASPQTTSGGVSLTRETKTGTVDDPSRERIELLLRFYP